MHNYNFYSYWYLSDCKFNVIDQKCGIFNSTYALYSWWAQLLLRKHIMLGDIDKTTIYSNSIWVGTVLLSTPYEFFQAPPKKPPDGIILCSLVMILLLETCFLFIINSTLKNFCLRIRIITFTDQKSDSSTGLSDTQKFSVFTTVHVLKSVDLSEYKAFTSFDSNSQTALVDNCANTHIWNVRSQFKSFEKSQNPPKMYQRLGDNHM